jgi:hypothetical protein
MAGNALLQDLTLFMLLFELIAVKRPEFDVHVRSTKKKQSSRQEQRRKDYVFTKCFHVIFPHQRQH